MEPRAGPAYDGRVQIFAKLLLVIATLLMPVGMSAAAARTTPTSPAMDASLPLGHCPQQPGRGGHQGLPGQCTMACAAALPAVDRISAAPLRIVAGLVLPRAPLNLAGVEPDIATPPPKTA